MTAALHQLLFSYGRVPSVSYRTTAEDNNALSTYTFASQDFGSARTDRYIVVSIHIRGTSPSISSVTIGGVTATSIKQCAISTVGLVAIYTAAVPTGTSGDVVVNLGASAIRVRIGVWALAGLNGAGAAEATASSTANPLALSLTATTAAVVIGACMDTGGDSNNYTWVGLTENFDMSISGGPNATTAASLLAPGGALTITATALSTSNAGGVSASFR